VLFGIAQDNPAATKPEDCRYDACIAIPENLRITNDNKVTTSLLPGGKYGYSE
jgi:DNA gyrase inhibitor GyrI